MTITAKIKNVGQDFRYKARKTRGRAEQKTRGRAKQTAGKATGNNRLRREGKAEVLKSRLNQFAKKIKDAIEH